MQLLRCSLINFTTISLFVDDISQFDYRKLTVKNGEVTILTDDYTTYANEIILKLKSMVDIKFHCIISYDDLSKSVSYHSFCSSKEFHDKYYTEEKLGVDYHKEGSTFRLWAPASTSVNVLIYESGDFTLPEKPRKYPMSDTNGLWEARVKGNLKGYFYTYEVKVYNEVNEVVDPYAVACGVNGLRGAIVDLKETNPTGFRTYKAPEINNYTDAIIYEANVRDLSIHPDSGIKHKGKYLGLAEEGTESSKGVSTGLAHILELGVTHVQLMPVFDYSYLSVDERHPYKYNWGYDPQNYNIPEGTYSTDPYNPTCRIYELKKAITQLHKNGLAVIMDVVYNHIYKYEDSNLEKIFPGYYFRAYEDGSLSNGSGCGNDIASERSMVRRFIIDSLLYWATEYDFDGFRFDLMGIHDVDTMTEICEKLKSTGKNLMLYGEGWHLNTNLREDQKANIYNSFKLKEAGFFNDLIRDTIKGSVFNIHDKGFVGDGEGKADTIKFCAVGCSLDWFNKPAAFYSPSQSINYCSCHDNYTLWDKLKLSSPYVSEEELKAMNKLADGIVLTSMGVPFLHAGSEFCRTKEGVENSYNSTDTINRMDWHRKSKYLDVFEYYKGLIRLRKEHRAFRLYDRAQISDHIEFLPGGRSSVAFMIKDHANNDTWKDIIVIYNGAAHVNTILIPSGQWHVVVNKHKAGTEVIETIEGGNVSVEATSIMVLYR
ncbi:type I pullulanase [Clostridium thermarum]|uniref:type I pullulanase n=1 Tax=Clostridium thermarum TaxID=1716543 RepID=UPI00111F915D|nr:type I pullulanase [Clostridium thermarum]